MTEGVVVLTFDETVNFQTAKIGGHEVYVYMKRHTSELSVPISCFSSVLYYPPSTVFD